MTGDETTSVVTDMPPTTPALSTGPVFAAWEAGSRRVPRAAPGPKTTCLD
jgi:hypothetical protein